MLKGINNLTNKESEFIEEVQILVTFSDDLNYYKTVNYRPIEKITFKHILGKTMDILGYEKLAKPFLEKSIKKIANEQKVTPDKIRCYILLDKSQKDIEIVSYLSTDGKTKLVCRNSLEEHFSSIN